MFRYVAPRQLGQRPHVIVDGAPRPGTVYTLSHWPGTPTPMGVRADLSAESARLALHHPERLDVGVDVASIDHYDVDGVVALALVAVDGLDEEHGPVLVEAARVGDFGVVTDRRAALIAFALQALEHREGVPGSGPGGSPGRYDALERSGTLAGQALDLILGLADDPLGFEHLWGDECRAYDAACRAFVDGWATIEEIPALDLAVVRVDDSHNASSEAVWNGAPLHPAAVHSATTCLRVATVAGGRMELRYRYESWVRMTRPRPRPRVDLERLAADLTAQENAKSRWVFDGAGALRPALHLARPDAASSVSSDQFLNMICDSLAVLDDGPAAWDPYSSSKG